MPIDATGLKSAQLIPNAELKVYEGSSHGIALVPGGKERFNQDVLEFLRKWPLCECSFAISGAATRAINPLLAHFQGAARTSKDISSSHLPARYRCIGSGVCRRSPSPRPGCCNADPSIHGPTRPHSVCVLVLELVCWIQGRLMNPYPGRFR